jgi:hypothetical protein
MTFVAEQPFGLVEKLRISENFASHIIRQGHLHAEPGDLRHALDSIGPNNRVVLKNWVFGLIETQPEMFLDPAEAERFVDRTLREKMLDAFPGACEL